MPPAVPPGIDEDHAAVSALVPVRTLSQLVPAAPLAASPEESGTVVSPRAWTDLGTAHQRTPQDSLRRDSPRQATEEAASHWFALQRLLGGRPEGAATIGGEESALPAPELRAPVVAFFSVAGGAGKTSLTANVARALSARGEQVLAVETSAFGILPFYFGARDLRPGTVRTFASNVGNVPIHVLSLDTEQQGKDRPAHWLQRELYRASRDVSRILIDVSSGFHGVIDEVLRLNAAIVIPVVADVSTVASLQAVDACFRARQPQNDRVLPYFLLNQFDPVQPLHQEVRQLLAQQFGDRLLPLAVRRSPLVSEAVAQGLTVIDYAPTTQLSEDIHHLAGWLRGLAQAGATSFRGVRWSER